MGVTVNALLPGGVSRTGMVPDGLPATIKLLPPEVMVPPLLWLMSDAAGTVTGRRFNAAKWDATLDPSAASAAADESAGWPLPN